MKGKNQSGQRKAIFRKLKKGDKVLANFTGGLEEGIIFDKYKIGNQTVYDISSIKRPNQKISSLRRDFKDVNTGK